MAISSGKSTDPILWDDYCMAAALLAAKNSEDPNTKVGACVVYSMRTVEVGSDEINKVKILKKNKILGTGYNSMPVRCKHGKPLPLSREGNNKLDTKYPYICHAAMDAIMDCQKEDLEGCSIYVSILPCNVCAKLIIMSGITEVVYLRNKYEGKEEMQASEILFKAADIKTRQYIPKVDEITIDFKAFMNARTDEEAMDC